MQRRTLHLSLLAGLLALSGFVSAQPKWDLPLMAELSQVMRDASICGLGQAAPNPMDSVVKYFPQELA